MPLAAAPGFPVALVVAGVLVLAIVGAGIAVSRMRRAPGGAAPAATGPTHPAASALPEEPTPASGARPDPRAPGTIWGLHVPGTPVQRMAKSVAVGFAMIDPEETSRVVHSADDGANWWALPRERWGEDL